ncbi:hypothetical protein Tco_0442831 [Tanacetum coccineum]
MLEGCLEATTYKKEKGVTMADMNIPANDAPDEQAPDFAPLIRTYDQILPVNKWVPIGKSNCVLDVLKSQRNPIFPIADTMCFNSSTGLYSCQLDEQWFNLHKDLLKDVIDITPTDDNNPFVAPPSSDVIIDYVNTLGYPNTLKNVLLPIIIWGYHSCSNRVLLNGFGEKKCLFNPYKCSNLPGRTSLDMHVIRRRLLILSQKSDTPNNHPSPGTKHIISSKNVGRKSCLKKEQFASYEASRSLLNHGCKEDADLERALEGAQTQGPARPVVIREPKSGRIQPLPEAGLNPGEQDEGQAGPNPSTRDEGQAGSNPGDTAGSQPPPSHVVYVGPNLEHMDLETTDASNQHKPEQMDEGFTIIAYPNVQENLKLPTKDQVILEEPTSSTGTLSSLQNLDKDLSFTDKFFVEKPHEENSGKTNAETEVQSMV